MINTITPQLTLGLSLQDEATFDNFCSGKNAEIVVQLKNAVAKQSDKVIYLCGNQDQGKSHLLQACCHYAQQLNLTSVYIPLANFAAFTPDILMGLEILDIVCLDDVHLIAGKKEWEEQLFHLYNRMVATSNSLIFSARDLPQEIQLSLPDLISRLSWGMVYPLYTLLDEEKLSILILRAKNRGMNLSEEVGKYILTHYPRRMSALFVALDKLDKASLAAQRRLTIPFIKEVLQI